MHLTRGRSEVLKWTSINSIIGTCYAKAFSPTKKFYLYDKYILQHQNGILGTCVTAGEMGMAKFRC